MKELQQKQRAKQRLYSTPVLIILFILAIFLVKGTYQVIQKQLASRMHVKELELKAAALGDRELQLKQSINRLSTEDGIDAEIKDKFNVAKPGEHVAVIVDKVGEATSTPPSTSPWYIKLWKSIRGL